MSVKLKKFILLTFISFTSFFSYTQTASVNASDAAERIENSVNDFDLFLNEFENWNVGNLHVFSKPGDKLLNDYYFKGDKIDERFTKYLSNNLQKVYKKTNGEVYAVGSIRGIDREQLYIIRTNTKKRPHQLALYRLVGKQLQPVQMLAYQYKNWWGRTMQFDTWIQDVDGDTRLDLIQKGRKTNRKGDVLKEATRVYLQQDDGTFIHSKNVSINPDDYIFEEL